MKTRITLKELAKLLNVSVSTVSKALNDSPEISPKTIERVKELAALHKYRPNPTAVNLKSSKSGTIGVIIPNIANSFFAKVLSGMEASAQREGLQVITYISNESHEREKQIAEMLTAGFVDGVLIAIAEETQRKKDFDHIMNIIQYDIPVVLYDRIDFDMPVDKVGIDDRKIFYDATRDLQSKGVKKIGLATSIHHMGVGKARIEGYRKALGEDYTFFIANSAKMESLKEKILIMILEDKVEAVLCSDFDSTMLTYRLAYENKLIIPEDLKIIGFIRGGLAKYLTPSVSYVDQSPDKIGAKAMEVLIGRINRKKTGPKEKILIDTEVVHYESTQFPEKEASLRGI
ncbi:LacI family DNA-binding transcriptional regulator [Salinimicrobium sediminilitoris]|uniref:LacI family DNA-binding transcriptional regulator n=1 Tax=Salinimicrobium sediminilitoris TaxID=2876715 RepID=UPI001E4B2ED8|nr:LacI family DNA-binding transcriptional regulator [Salinimicrobium sediminilitoris]MCC8358780.1 LacI family transcriptional regulator [Salinimicrobium sediminilitoris]